MGKAAVPRDLHFPSSSGKDGLYVKGQGLQPSLDTVLYRDNYYLKVAMKDSHELLSLLFPYPHTRQLDHDR